MNHPETRGTLVTDAAVALSHARGIADHLHRGIAPPVVVVVVTAHDQCLCLLHLHPAARERTVAGLTVGRRLHLHVTEETAQRDETVSMSAVVITHVEVIDLVSVVHPRMGMGRTDTVTGLRHPTCDGMFHHLAVVLHPHW